MPDHTARFGRRLIALNVAALGVAVPPASAQGPKSGFRGLPAESPPAARPGGVSDSDPTDPPGQGRGGTGPRAGVTDSDPTDPPGQGRGGAAPRAGVSDSDPSDPPGRGRGGGGRAPGISDRDPSDPPGRGRGGRPPEKST